MAGPKISAPLRARGERYLLGVPSHPLAGDLEKQPPADSGRSRHPLSPFLRLDHWLATLPQEAWTEIDVRDGEKGPLVIEVVKRRVQAWTATADTAAEESRLVSREHQSDSTFKHNSYLLDADVETALPESDRVAQAAHRIEECFERSKGEMGLADYQVRYGTAWHGTTTRPCRCWPRNS
jgi:hypothetical protein